LSSGYKIDNTVINIVTSAKYVGVTISHGKSTSLELPTKPTQLGGFLQHNLRQWSINVKSLAYTTYTRPILGYVCFSCMVQAHKNLLEMIQHKAALIPMLETPV